MNERGCVVVELKRAGESVDDLWGGTLVPSLFEAQVVVRADSAKHRELFPSQSGHPPHAGTWQTHVLGLDERASRLEVLAQRCARRHPETLRRLVMTVQGKAVGLAACPCCPYHRQGSG